ncbi:M24 family metallopeptidase, partial [Saccharophagus degradans]
LAGKLEDVLDKAASRQFYMHRIGHWLGMAVPDVGDYQVGGAWRVLEPGMVRTVEPGIYVSPVNTNVPKKWRGIGNRID